MLEKLKPIIEKETQFPLWLTMEKKKRIKFTLKPNQNLEEGILF